MLKHMITKKKQKIIQLTPFFDYSDEQKKAVLERSMEDATRMQKDLIKRYNQNFAYISDK